MLAIQSTPSKLQEGMLRHKFVMRQEPPAPMNFVNHSNTQTNTIFGLPAGYIVCGVRVQLITTFSSLGLTSCQVSIGAQIGLTNVANFYAPGLECVQPVSTATFRYWSPFTSYTTAAHDITANFVASGAQMAAITAGEIEITILYRSM